jgi:hypothetical protein
LIFSVFFSSTTVTFTASVEPGVGSPALLLGSSLAASPFSAGGGCALSPPFANGAPSSGFRSVFSTGSGGLLSRSGAFSSAGAGGSGSCSPFAACVVVFLTADVFLVS